MIDVYEVKRRFPIAEPTLSLSLDLKGTVMNHE